MRRPRSPILLVGNYQIDHQHSMLKYATMLYETLLKELVDVHLVKPKVVFGRLDPKNKWLGYLDKLILFPWQLRKKVLKIESSRKACCVVHVCDHSNSPLFNAVAKQKKILTCHDLIAIRSANNEFSGQLPRFSGRTLQAIIKKAIPRANHIACVSKATESDLHALLPTTKGKTSVVHNGFNAAYRRQPDEILVDRLSDLKITPKSDVLLHVGSNAWYKNRMGVLRIFKRYKSQASNPNASLVLAGPELDAEQYNYAKKHGLTPNIQCTGPLSHAQLEALYCISSALIFPSRYEGFGWPPLEAQCCGCPVIASSNGSLDEVIGDSAPTSEWDDTKSHVEALKNVLLDEHYRQKFVDRGFENVKRFSAQKMAEHFSKIYCALETHTK